MKIKLSKDEKKWLAEYLNGLKKYAKGSRQYNRMREAVMKKLAVEGETVKFSQAQYNFICNFTKSIIELADHQLGRLQKPTWYEFWKVSRNIKINAVRASLERSKRNAEQLLTVLAPKDSDGEQDK